MPVDEYVLNLLSPKEKIEDSYKSRGLFSSTIYYATNKRIIRYYSGIFSKSFRDLDYRSLVSIEFEEKLNLTFLISGALSLGWGLIHLLLYYLASQPLGFISWFIPKGSIESFSYLFIIGIFLIIISVIFKQYYFQFCAPSLKLEQWRLYDNQNQNAKDFISTIRRKCFFKDKNNN